MSDKISAIHPADYVVLQLALPGQAVSNIGIYLLDPSADRGYLRLRSDWQQIAADEDREVLEPLGADLERLSDEMGGRAFLGLIEDSFSNVIQLTPRETVNVGGSTSAGAYPRALARLYEQHVEPVPIRRFETHLPLYSLRAAATRFGEDMEVDEHDPETPWLETPQSLKLDPRMFIARVVGPSMEPLIPDGSLCIFRAGVAGSRQGKRLLVWERATSDSGGRYTVKTYRSTKQAARPHDPAEEDASWEHSEIVLEPLNPAFQPMRYTAGDEGRAFRVIGEFVQVLEE